MISHSHSSKPSPGSTQSPQNEARLPSVFTVPLEPVDSLSQVQKLVGWRPVLMVGEGSHRTEDFFEVQASLAGQAVERGCKHIFIELPQLWGVELNRILASDGERERIADFVRANYYPTWSSNSIVSLLEKIFDLNQNKAGEPIQVHAIDPQARGAARLLKQLINRCRDPKQRSEIQALKDSWISYEKAERRYFAACQATDAEAEEIGAGGTKNDTRLRRAQETQALCLDAMKRIEPGCKALANNLLRKEPLSADLGLVASAIAEHLDIMTAARGQSISRRDRYMARKILDSMPNMPSSRQEAPLAVVLAHNNHVAFGPPLKQGDWYSQGMGTAVREALQGDVYGDNPCTVICQVSAGGKVAYMGKKEIDKASPDGYSHGSMIKGDLSTVPSQMGERVVAMRFPPALVNAGGKEMRSCGKIQITDFGGKDPRETNYFYSIVPAEHMDLLFLHRRTVPARLGP